MQNVLLVIHLIACIALVIAVLLQRSEGGALGMGGGGTGGLISGRGASSVLVKVTMGLAATFITTSIVMTRLNADQQRAPTAIERELEERSPGDAFDPLSGSSTTPPPASQPTPADPLSPPLILAPPATQPPATPAPQPSAPAPANPTPAPSNAAPAAPAPSQPATPPAEDQPPG
jgi:preprotein translocase subunit SecG